MSITEKGKKHAHEVELISTNAVSQLAPRTGYVWMSFTLEMLCASSKVSSLLNSKDLIEH